MRTDVWTGPKRDRTEEVSAGAVGLQTVTPVRPLTVGSMGLIAKADVTVISLEPRDGFAGPEGTHRSSNPGDFMLTSPAPHKPHFCQCTKALRMPQGFQLESSRVSLSPHSLSQSPLNGLTLAASVVFQQDVARGTGTEVGARLVNTLMLAEELREAALVHIWGSQITPVIKYHRLPGGRRPGGRLLVPLISL